MFVLWLLEFGWFLVYVDNINEVFYILIDRFLFKKI